MAMTLDEVWNWHKAMSETSADACDRISHRNMADAIDAHITQPAQAVDVGAIREVAQSLAGFKQSAHVSLGVLHQWADKLTAALPTTPTPDKDQR